jgi:CBS domain-containing protein
MTTSKLGKLHARDVMQREVFALDPESSIEDAIRAFNEMHIGGAPVVDRTGRVLGVLSANDIARPENLRDGSIARASEAFPMSDEALGEDEEADEEVVLSMEDFSPALQRGGAVSDFMNPDVISVASDAPIAAVCQLMVTEHIHRVLVVDKGELAGIISTLDIVRAVAENA